MISRVVSDHFGHPGHAAMAPLSNLLPSPHLDVLTDHDYLFDIHCFT